MARTSKRPCRFCRRWFKPDPRQHERQYACSAPGCQARRKASNQADWLAENPGYFRGRAEKHRQYRQAHPEAAGRRKERRSQPEAREHERADRGRRRQEVGLSRVVEQDARSLQLLLAKGDQTRLSRAGEQDAWLALSLVVIGLVYRLSRAGEQDSIGWRLPRLHDWGRRLMQSKGGHREHANDGGKAHS